MESVRCPNCGSDIPDSQFNTAAFEECATCHSRIQAVVFPAFYREAPKGERPENAVLDDEATCYYLPDKKAVAICEGCGVFLSSLYVFELDGKTWCPKCVEKGKQTGKLKSLEETRTNYDSVALSLAILPILFWPFTLVTAPAALGMAIWFWKRPGSFLPRSKIRFVFAILIALLQIAGWIALFVMLSLEKI